MVLNYKYPNNRDSIKEIESLQNNRFVINKNFKF